MSIDPVLAQTYDQLAETLAQNALATGSPGRALLLTCNTTDDACAKKITSDFAVRAWRRPLAAGELDNLFALYSAARLASFSFEQGLQTMVEGALLSPNFLFRPELDAVPDSPTTHTLGPYELASRLSYLLWSSMPDAALQASAAHWDLATSAGLQTQVARMWASPNAEAFFQRFPGQWLHTLNVIIAKTPAADVFPAFNATLEAAMEGETAHFMRELMTTDSDMLSINGIAVDASGVLDPNKNFNGALQLEQILKTDARVPRAIVQYVLSYALGRELTAADSCLLDDVSSAFQTADQNRMQALVKRIVALPVMQSRRGAP